MIDFADLVAQFHNHFSADPNAAVYLGLSTRLDELPDPTTAHAQATAAAARALLARFDEIAPEGLSFDEQLDVDLARLALNAQILRLTHTFNGRTEAQQKPAAGDAIGDGIFMMFINDPRPAAERLQDITARIEAIPAYLEAALGTLDTPVQRWVDIELVKVAGLPSLFETITAWAAAEGWSDLSRLELATTSAAMALTSYAEALAALPTTANLHVGRTAAEAFVRTRGIDKSLEELHQLATTFLADTRASIEQLRVLLVARHGLSADTTTEALHAWLNTRFKVQLTDGDLDSVLTRYQAERERILEFVRERGLFPVLAEQDMKIMRTPGFMEPSIPAGAMMSPPPFRDGVRTSLVYLTLSPELLDEHTELGIPLMMIHEGIPGHHLQLATASTHESVIRRHFDAMDHAEGWTTMLEDYMLDVGYMGDLTDEARFCGKRDISRLGARVAIDLFFMTGDREFLDVGVDADIAAEDPFDAAANLLAAVTGFSPPRVQAELNWYSQERGYPLSYLTGNRLVWDLKRDVIAAQGDDVDTIDVDRAFHDVYLNSGNMPVRFLRRVMEHRSLIPSGLAS
jgi:uncharacterized protein (DUF885 family)